MSAAESMSLGIVVERRRSANPWQEYVWRPIEVVPFRTGLADWALLAEGADWTRYHAGALTLELFPKETRAYIENLSTLTPSVYVILRQNEDGDGPEVTPFHATVSSDEVRDYQDAGDDIVEAVPMPPPVRAWVEDFIARFHKEEVFEKYARKRWKDGGRNRRDGPPLPPKSDESGGEG